MKEGSELEKQIVEPVKVEKLKKPRVKYIKYKVDPNGIVYDVKEVVHK